MMILAGLAIWADAASAQAPQEQGWWTAANPGTSSVYGSQPPAPPDVPGNGLLIEGGQDFSSPVAYAGLVYQLPSGATASSLILEVAANSATTPGSVLELCPLTAASFQPEQGGPMSDAPTFSCSRHVTAGPSTSGSSYKFSVSSLATPGVLGVAILPTASTDRVVLLGPDARSLVTSTGQGVPSSAGLSQPSTDTGASGSQYPALTSSAAPSPASATGNSGLAVASPGLALSAALPSAAPAPSAPAPPTSQSAVSNPQQSSQGVTGPQRYGSPAGTGQAGSGSAKALAVLLVIAGALIGAGVWISAGNAAVRSAAASITGVDPMSTTGRAGI